MVNSKYNIDPPKNLDERKQIGYLLENFGGFTDETDDFQSHERQLWTHWDFQSRNECITEFKKAIVAAKLQKADTFLFWYNGHGFESDRQVYLLPCQIPTVQKDRIANSVSVSELLSLAADAPFRSIQFCIDTCRTSVDPNRSRLTQLIRGRSETIPLRSALDARVSDANNTSPLQEYVVLFSASSAQDALTGGEYLSPFLTLFSFEMAKSKPNRSFADFAYHIDTGSTLRGQKIESRFAPNNQGFRFRDSNAIINFSPFAEGIKPHPSIKIKDERSGTKTDDTPRNGTLLTLTDLLR